MSPWPKFCLGLLILVAGKVEAKTLVALGDSITQGFNASRLGNNPEYSWATGSAIDSLFQRMQPSEQDRAVDLAVSGATSSQMLWQVPFLPNDTTDLTILIGGNDACMGFHEDTVGNVRKALYIVNKLAPAASVTVSPVPRISSVFHVKKDRVWCRVFWTITGLCSGFLSPLTHDDTRQANQEKLDDLNQDLGTLVQDLNRSEFKNSPIKFARSVGETNLYDYDVSNLDCFHPSVQGQQRLADLVSAAIVESTTPP